MKHNKSHDRAADKMGFSIALKRSLVAEIERLAEEEGRNRNQQIVWMLGESLAIRAERRISEMVRPASTLREVPVPKKPKKNFTPDPDIQAGASTETKKRILPKEDGKTA